MAERFAEVEKASDPSKRTLEERLKDRNAAGHDRERRRGH